MNWNKMSFQEVLARLKSCLTHIYEKYKNQGMLSVYLWGSIVAGEKEFGHKYGDVDSLAIVNPAFLLELVSQIREELQTMFGTSLKFGFKLVCTDELDGTGIIRTKLATAIYPRILLHDMKYWIHVAGKKYKPFDFQSKPTTTQEIIDLRFGRLKKMDWNVVSHVLPHDIQYFLKEVTRIVDLYQEQRGFKGHMSYETVAKYANEDEKRFLNLFFELKKSGWNYELFQERTSLMQQALDTLLAKCETND